MTNPATDFLAALNRAYWLAMAATVSYFGGEEAMLGPSVSRQDSSPQQIHEGRQDNVIQNSSSSTAHALASTSTSMAADVSGFLLLTLPDCRIDCAGSVYQGTLALECITLAAGSESKSQAERDVWLVLRLDSFETPIPPTQPIIHQRAEGVYTIPGTPSPATLRLPLAAPNTPLREDLDTFEVLLAQYGVVHEAEGGPPAGTVSDEKKGGNLKGRLVLVDESDGEVVGTLGEGFTVHEDDNVTSRGREKDPVVVELPEYGAPQELRVHAVRPEESDALIRSAHFLSRGIVLATTAIAAGMAMASSKFVTSTAPNPTPVVFSEETRRNVKRVHKISGKAVNVTARTTGLIHRAVDQAASYLAGRSSSRAASPAPSPTSQYPPPLPPRKGLGSRAPSSEHLSAPTPPPLPPRKPRLLNSLLMSTDLILTTLEQSGKHLITHGTNALSSSMGHRYGADVGDAVRLGGETMRNVGVVYIDARGVGRRALLKRAGKGVVTARLGNKDVVFGADVPPPVPPRF